MKGSFTLCAGLRITGVQPKHVICSWVSRVRTTEIKGTLWISKNSLSFDPKHIQRSCLQNVPTADPTDVVHHHPLAIRGRDWLRSNSISSPSFGNGDIGNAIEGWGIGKCLNNRKACRELTTPAGELDMWSIIRFCNARRIHKIRCDRRL